MGIFDWLRRKRKEPESVTERRNATSVDDPIERLSDDSDLSSAEFNPDIKKSIEIDHDGQFIAYDNGTVKDTETGLEWYTGPDKDTSFREAKSWVEYLTVAGGGWRMPTREELKTLYKKGEGQRNMTPLLKTTGWFVCSGETKSSSLAFVFNFRDGWISLMSSVGPSDGLRGFAVRSSK